MSLAFLPFNSRLSQAGRNDGTISGVDYFDCKADHGLFLKNHSPQVRRAPSALAEEKRRGHAAYQLNGDGGKYIRYPLRCLRC